MNKKWIVSIIIIAVILLMILDFKYNNIRIIENLYRELETDSLRNLIEGNTVGSYHGASAELEFIDQIINIGDEIKELYIDNAIGSIEIRGEDREDILLSYKFTVYAENEELAESFIRQLSIVENTGRERLSLRFERPVLPKGVYGVQVTYELIVPERLSLDIRNSYGKLIIDKMAGDVTVKNSYDLCQITDIGGRTEITAHYGKLIVRNIDNDLKVESRFNSGVDISNIGGDLILDTKYTKTKLADIAGNLEMKSEADSVSFDRIKGDLRIKADYTNLVGNGVEGKITGKVNYGQFDLFRLMNDIDLDASYIDVEIYLEDDLDRYQVYCETEFGDIRSNLPYGVEKENRRQILSGGDGEKTIKIVNEFGDIRLYK